MLVEGSFVTKAAPKTKPARKAVGSPKAEPKSRAKRRKTLATE